VLSLCLHHRTCTRHSSLRRGRDDCRRSRRCGAELQAEGNLRHFVGSCASEIQWSHGQGRGWSATMGDDVDTGWSRGGRRRIQATTRCSGAVAEQRGRAPSASSPATRPPGSATSIHELPGESWSRPPIAAPIRSSPSSAQPPSGHPRAHVPATAPAGREDEAEIGRSSPCPGGSAGQAAAC
jgi:hypothetical protein